MLLSQVITTLLLTLFVSGILLLIFRWIKTPYYRVDRQRMIAVLERVLTGQASDNDWQMTFGITIRHDPDLEAIRQRCIAIEEKYSMANSKPPYLFSPLGLADLQTVLEALKSDSE